MDATFLQARIDATKLQIVAYEDAITALTTGGVQSYSLNTGQSTQTVSRFDITKLQSALDGLYNRVATLQARLDGSGVSIGRPAW